MKGNGTLTKVIGGLVVALIMTLLGIALSGSSKASEKACEVERGQIGIQKDIEYIQRDVAEMKIDQKAMLTEIRRIKK